MGIGGVSTNLAFSAVTFYGDGSNLTGISTHDTYITGGTYNPSTGTATFTNNTGGKFSVSGFSTGSSFTGGTVSGATIFTGGLSAHTFSATTYYNLPSSTFTGGTVSGATIFTNGLTATTISATSYNGYNPLPTQAAISSGVTLSFITDTVYGTLSTPETSSAITANVTGALLGVTNILIHSGSTTPTFGVQYKKLSGSGNYSAGTINYIFCTYIASTEIIYSINQR
jgi:hypothetical protein